MAIFRQIPTDFWIDDFIGELEPLQKLLYVYLWTNKKTTQCGVYQLSMRYTQFETGLDKDQIIKYLKAFETAGRVYYNPENNEIMLNQWLKVNSAKSPKVAKVIDNELLDIQTLEFGQEVIKKCHEYGYPIVDKTVPNSENKIHYRYPIDTVSKTENRVSQKNINHNINHNHKITEQQQDKGTSASVKSSEADQGVTKSTKKPAAVAPKGVYTLYQQVFGVMNSIVQTRLNDWVNDLGEELVTEAMNRAALAGKTFSYADGILKQWDSKNISTMEQVKADDVAHNNQKRQYHNQRSAQAVEPEPDWFKEQQQGQDQPKQPEPNSESDSDLAAMFAELEQAKSKNKQEAKHDQTNSTHT
ncbi:DnaD domain protein [Lactobacillus sp. CC-MHH1034]|uniref:DnaD domain-containing protein n=1 Tax=Agrilactobacillus fermenti TaxID=2586909 RepID=UPI001E37640B|nr:DnaD domain protein [Agrilactobacillus fermenti]MCD2257114.1 DnaD domain protein [Agrilactobacillus fermenti]